MASPSPSMAPDPDGDNQETILVVVAILAGTLFLLVVLLCLIVGYLYFRKDRIAQKKTTEIDNRHRLFREPAMANSKFDDIIELEGIEQSSFFREGNESKRDKKKPSQSSKKTSNVEKEATRSNPTFGKEDLYADALELPNRNRKPRQENATEQENGIVNQAIDISDEQRSPSTGDKNAIPPGSPQSSKGGSPASPGSPVSNGSSKVNILNLATWKKVEEGEETKTMEGDIPSDGGEVPTSDGEIPGDEVITTESNELPPNNTEEGVFTISGSNPESRTVNDDINDVIDDEPDDEPDEDTYYMYSAFQRSDSQKKRSFQTQNSAVIDFYEGGDSDRVRTIDTRSTANANRDTFWDGFAAPTGDSSEQGLLWQNKRIF